MNKINIEEMKRYLKRSLKKKVKITTSLIVLFMMSNSIVSMANYITIDNGKIGEGGKGDYRPGAIALNPKGEGDSKPQKEVVGAYSIAIGLGSEAKADESVAIGHGSKGNTYDSVSIGHNANTGIEKSVAIGSNSKVYNFETKDGTGGSGQGVAVGSNAVAVSQATSVGNDTYAIGHSSIALGSDDIDIYYGDKISNYDYEHYFQKLYDKIDYRTEKNLAKNEFPKYGFAHNNNGKISIFESAKFSPTLAQGKGAIAIGSRSVAYENGTTALGTLAFALKEKSTALGTHTRAEGVGAIAIGNDTKVFSDNSVGAGNNIQILKKGGMGFGYDIISGGENSISIGTKVYSNVTTNSLNDGIHREYLQNKNDFLFGNTYVQDNLDKLGDTLEKREGKDDLQNNKSFDISKDLYNGVANVGKSNGFKNAITIGTSSMALSENSVGIGHGTFSTAKNSMALGSYSYVNGENSLGLGVYSKVFSKNSIAIGTGSGVAYNADNSLVMGVASYSKGMNGLVFGNKAKVEKENGSAIGNETQVTLSNSMALGHKSKTDYTKEELEKDAYEPKGVLSMPSTENIGVISVGSKGAERRIVNVAAGYRDTDAVNVSQLKAMEEKINQSGLMDVEDDDLNISDNGIHYLSVDKNGYRSKDIKEIMQKQRDYNKYIEYKSRQLEMKAREAKGDQLPISYKTKINAKVENLEKKYENDTQFNQIELKKITDQEIEKIKNNGVSFDSIITKINLAKEKDKYITYTDENGQEIQKLKTILYEDEVKKINESNYNNKGAIGKDSIALGYQTKSTGDKGIAIGTGDQRSLDILENQKIIDITRGEEKQKLVNKEVKLNNNMYTRSGENAVAVGTGAIAKDWSVALGGNTQTEDTAVAIGDRSKALGNRSIAIGNKAATGRYYEFNGKEKINETLKKLNGQTLNYDSIGMVGYDGAEKAIAIGSHSTATSDYSVAIGNGATTGDDKNTKEIYVKDRTKNDLTESEQATIIRKHFHKDENSFNQDEKNRLQSLIKDYELKNLDRQKQEILEKNYYLKENEVNKDANKKKIFDELVRSINAKTEQEKKDAKEKILQKYFHKKESELTRQEKIEFQKKVSDVQVDNKEMILQKYFAKSKYDQLSSEEKKDFDKLIKDLTDSEKENLLRTYFMGKKEEELTPAEKKEFDDFKDKFKKKVKIGGAENAIAIGKYAKASKNDTIALGKDSNAVGEKAIAIGKESKANGSQSVVIGTPNSSNNKTDEDTDSNIGEISAGTSSVSVGNGVKSGNYSVGIGGNVVAGNTAVAIGDRSRAIGDTSVAIGEKALAKGVKSIAIGNETKANAEDSYVFGGKSEISQNAGQSSAIGINISVKSAQAVAMGNDVLIEENSRGAVAIGSDDSEYNEGNNKIGGNNYTKTTAKGNATTAIGAHAQATNVAATALGARAFATEKETVAVGANSKASVEGAVAIGSYSVADQQKNATYYNPKTGNTDGKVTDKLATKAALSIGDANHQVTRQIIGLAAGTNDTDAVNVWQLKELKGYFDENKNFKLEGDKNGEKTFELPNKLEIKGNTEKKNDGKTYQDWDSTYTVENVQTHISKSGNNAKILIGIKNKPRFDKVYVGNETTGLEIAQDNNNNITLKQNGATLTLTKDNNNFKISGLANGVVDNDAVAYGQVKNPFIVKADMAPYKTSTEKSMGLGNTLEFTGRKIDGTAKFDSWTVNNADNTKNGNYTSENVETFVTQDNSTGKTSVLIGLRKDPRFDKVTVGEEGINITKKVNKVDKVVKFGIDDEGNATLTDTRNDTASPIVTEKSLGDQKIKYAATNGNVTTNPKKETTLTNGFNFSGGTNTEAEVDENGVVKFNLKNELTGITSIEKGTNGAKITLKDDSITVNKKITGLEDGSIEKDSKEAINGGQLHTKLADKLDKTTYETDKQTFATKTELETSKVEVVGTKDEIAVTSETKADSKGIKYTVKLEDALKTKIDGALQTSTAESTYAKKDASNITEDNWVGKLGDASIENGTKLAKSSAVKAYVDGKGLKFAGNTGDESEVLLGNKLSIVGEGDTNGETATNNITVASDKENKKLTVKLAKDLQNIGSVTFKQGDKTSKISIDNSTGDLNITKNGKTENILTTNNIGNQEISYKGSSDTKVEGKINSKKTTLTTGFDFTSDDLEIKTENDGKVTFNLTDKVKNSLNGKGNDGRDGKSGNDSAGSHGLTGQDGLNGKDLTTKVNALRNGEAGTVVYTDKDGNRLVKSNDGKYYKAEYVDDNGNLKAEHSNADEVKDILATLVNPDGSTKEPTTKLRVADGRIEKDSKDAINGGQLHTELDKKLDKTTYETDKQTFATKTELETSKVEVVGTENEIVVTPETKTDGKGTKYTVKLNDTLKTKIDGALQTSTAESTYAKKDASNITEAKWVEKLGDTSLENGTKLAKSSAVKEYVDKIKSGLEDKGLKFTADNAADNLVKLGETLSIVGRSGANNLEVKTWKHGPNDQQDKQEDYTTENVTTHYEKATDGKQQIFVGIKEKPTFKKITLKDGETKQVDLTPTKDGLSLNGKKLTGLEAGTENTDAINKKQFDDALANKANSTDLNSYAKIGLDNISVEGKKVIKGLINVSTDDKDTDNIATVTGGDNTEDGNAKEYKVSVKKSTIEGIAQAEAKKFVSDSVTVSSTDNAIEVTKDTATENKVEYKLKLNQAKIKELSGTTNLATEYAKVDASNLDKTNETTNRDKWINKLGTEKISKTITENADKGKLTTEKAVVDYVKQEIDTVNKNIGNTIAYKANSGDSKTTSLTTGFDFTSTDLKIETGDNGKVTFNLTDTVKNSLNGKGNDGRDEKSGNDSAGSHGLTGQDGLNGKDLTTKVNALRNGEAGTVVYTDKDGNRLVKSNDGKYYKAEYVDDNGNLKAEHSNADEVKDILATLVNPDGSTKEPTTKLRVADGRIEKDSKDAINGGQLHTELDKKLDKTTYETDKQTFATKTELETSKVEVVGTKDEIAVTSETKADSKGIKYTVKLEDALKTKIDGALQTSTAESTYAKKDASNITEDNWVGKLGDASIENGTKLAKSSAVKTYVDGKGLKFTADNAADNLVKLGETLSIVGRSGANNLEVKTWKHGPNDQQDKQEDYTTENVTTHYEKATDGKQQIFVGIKESPTFKKITLKDGDTKQVDLTPTKDGLSLNDKKLTGLKDEDVNTNDNYGTAGVAATQKEVKDYVAKEITKVNDTVSSSKLKLNDGKQTNPQDLNIKDETLELVDGTNTTVTLTKDDTKKKATFKVDVKGDLTGITSISKENGAKLTLNDDNITVNKKITGLADGEISNTSTDAITGKQLKAKETELKSEIAKKADATDLSGYAKVDGSNVNTLDDTKKKAWAAGIGTTSISDTTKDQLVTGSAVKTYVDGRVLKFEGNTGSESEVLLGNKLSIVGEGDTTIGETATNNITVASDKENKKLTVKLAKDLQNIGSVTFKQGDKTSKISIDNSTGDLNITKNGKTENILTTNNIGNQEISYKGSSDTKVEGKINSKKTTLTTGFDFTSDDLEIKTENDGKVTFNLTDEVKNSLNGKGNDGRDGKSGTNGAGSKGLTGKDGLNGKDLTTKVNALRNGEAGTVVYTDSKGNRLVKANDGKYYEATNVNEKGEVQNNATAKKDNEILATLVNSDGSTKEPTTKLRVADGRIAKDSKDAINGGQLNNLGYMLGLEVNGKNTGFKAPKISDLKGTNTTPANILDGLNQTREHINKGLTFEANYNADGYGKSSVNKIFGETLSITASGAENGKYAGKNNENYTGTNLATYVRTDTDGKKKFYIGMKETPTFKSINIGSTGFGDHQTDTGKGNITADDNGLTLIHDKASITISKADDKTENKAKISGLKDFDVNDKTTTYGQSGVAATQKEVKDYVDKEITKVNASVASSTLKLSDGTATNDLNIKDETLEIANGTNTTVTLTKNDTNKKATFKVDVKGDLTKITSISSGDNKAKITLNEKDITVNNKKITGLEDGSIKANSKDAINGGQLNNLGYMLGLEVNEKNTGFKAPKISDLKGTNATPANILDGLNQTREHINKGLTFEANYNADGYGKSSVNKIFGETLSITASGAENGKYVGKDNSNYTGDNLATYVKQGKFYIGMKETPTFKEVKLSNSGKDVKFGIDDKGNATLTDGQNNTASPIVTEATVGVQKISYAANSENKKETTLTTGFDFTSDDLEIKTENDGKVTFNLTDKVKNSLNGKGNDGRDGKSGNDSAGSHGLTGQDGLNGKDLTTKVNALRNGEAGTVVYTDKDGNRLAKANDGKYYKAEYVEDNGNLKTGHSSTDEVKDILATLVNPDGSTAKPTTKLRVADGSIAKDSKDAINGGQLNNLGYMLGLEVNEKNTGFKAPKITDLKGTNTTPANILDGLNQTREQMNKGLTFEANYNADPYGTSNINKMLGGTLSITASGAENGKYAGTNNANYTGTNLATYVRTDTDGKKKFYIGMKETPTFKSINIGSTGFGDHQTDTGKGDITVDNEGLKLSYDKASITISKDGDKAKLSGLKDANIDENTYGTAGVAATQKEVKDYVAKEITKVNDSQSKLKNGTLGTVVYTDKDGNKLMKDIDGKFYKANADGTKEENAKEVVSEDVILSTVKPDGKTTEPITLGNVASALGLSKDKKDKKNEILNKLVNKEDKKDVFKDSELNKVVTLRDLQFLASKGITFAGSTGTATKFLGDTITINGTTSNYNGLDNKNFATKYETKNIAVKVDNNTGNIEVGLAKELSKINSITSEEDAKDKTKTKITLSKDGATFEVEKDDNTTTQQVGAKTTIGKDGISITKQDEQKPSVSIKAGDTTKGPSIDFATKEEGEGNNKKTVGTGSITGLEYRKASDTTNDYGTGANIGRAATEGAVKEIYDKLSNVEGNINTLNDKGLTFVGNSGDAKVKKLGDTVNIKGEGTVVDTNNKFESAKGNINVVANDSGVELQLAANLKNMKSFETENDKDGNSTKLDQKGLTITDKDDKNSGTKENPRNTVEITKDKIVFKKEYKDGTDNKSDNGIVIDNSKGTISGVKDGDTPDSVVTKGYIDNKLKSLDGNKPFEYYEKNKDTVFAKDGTEYKAGTIVTEDGKVYAKGTQEVEGKYFAEGDKVVKAKDGKFYKEKDIKDRTYDEATKKWSGDSAQPTEATEAKALEGDDLKNAKAEDKVVVKGKNNKFYEASDLEKAVYDEVNKEYTKDGNKLKGKEAKDVVIKALPNNEAMTLSNIANARLVKDSKDAVNAGQMLEELDKKMNKDGSNIDKKEFANNVSEGANITKPEGILVTDKQVNEHLSKNYYNRTEVDAKVSNISNTVVEANKKSDLALGGVANAVAMANLLQANSYSKYKTNISAAYGYYGGSNALAIGFSGVSENRMVSYRVSGSVNTKGNIALGAGLGVMLGEFKTDKYPEKGKKISELEEKLRLQTEKTNKLEKQLEEILKLLKK